MDLALGDAALIVASGLGTAVGALAVLVVRSPGERLLDALLGFTAGIMLAAAIFSLLVPALDRGTLAEVVAGLAVGAAVLAVLDALVPHIHTRLEEREEREGAANRALLLLSALVIHNVPEGMAVGVAFAAGGPELGVPIAIAIGIQNVPEGFVASAPLLQAGLRRRSALAIGGSSGLVEPPAAFLAFGAVSVASVLLAPGLAFAAGAMIYVVVDELVPESHGHGHEREATLMLLLGFVVMMVLDNAFG